ncbi:MAG: hypothetical protein DMF63_04790 [Acidobacteria bacterium]|nr:MAG: hypothetical protein DMF63_04790 [Acidobacteriota bacterium]
MKRFILLVVAALVAMAVTACAPAANTSNNASANNVKANANTAKPAAAPPTKEALVALDKSAYEAWKTKDAKFWDPFLAANFVGYGAKGKIDRATAIKEYSGSDCDVKSYALTDEQMTALGADAALITYKITMDGTCGGQKLPANSWGAGVYVREGDKWKGAFHAESPMPDPNAKPTGAAAAKPGAPAATEAKSDAATDALFTLEKKAWDDWKNKNKQGLEDWASANFSAFTSNGRQDRAGAIKGWTEDKCEVKSVSLTDPSSVSFSPDFSLLTFKAAVDGKCEGNAIPSENGISIYGKEGSAWKAIFTMATPMM